ncbi:MAG: hypothetical protein ACLFVJ_18735 [Persicimonas sp.]
MAVLVLGACSDAGSPANNAPSNNAPADASQDAANDISDESDDSDAGDGDTGSDADTSDADSADTDSSDAGDATDDEVPLAGFGEIEGQCGVLDDELTTDDSYYIVNRIDFGADPYDDGDESLLTEGGREILADGNAGGSSVLSEVFAYEVLERCELATLLKSETEISYTTSDSKLADMLVEIDTLKIGVSVTRAVGWPRDDPYTVEQARSLLEDKFSDIQDSTANVAAEDAWTKQILHVIAYEDEHATSLETAYGQLDASVTADSVVFVTVTDGDDAFLY